MSSADKLIKNYYQSWFRFHPEVAVDAGVEGYAHLLTPCDDDDIGALSALNEMLLSALEELDRQDLSEDQCLDLDILRRAATLELKELVEQDWRRRDPLRFLPVHAIYQLTLRIMLDVELHTRGLSLVLASERLQLWLGFTSQQAKADLEWYTRMPTVPMGYATGWALINAARTRLQSMDADFSLRNFHDRLLSMGSVPVSKVIPRRFGDPLWASVHREVFSAKG